METTMQHMTEIDPQWAWSTYEPSPQQPWDARRVRHLYRRAGFGASPAEISEALKSTPGSVVDSMFSAESESSEFRSTADSLARTVLAAGDPKQLAAAWTYRLLGTPHQLLEKAVIFWHGHFSTGADKVKDAGMMWNQNLLLRQHALGKLAPLVQSMAQDPAMLIYLDSATNRKSHPNENFARELMELFCLGEGNYGEQDVRELARCFTGWEIKNSRFRKNKYQQDTGIKLVLGQSGAFDGEEAVAIVLDQAAAPLFICRKLVRFFVADEPALTNELIAPLANLFRDEDLNIASVISRILTSNLFYSPHALARKIRSPVELLIGLLRSLEGTTNALMLAQGLEQIGQGLFFPPNVKGWDGGRAWINSSTLLGRANLVYRVLKDEHTHFANGSLDRYLHNLGLHDDQEVVRWLADALLAVPLATPTETRLIESLQSNRNDREAGLLGVVNGMATLPEFQLG